MCLFSFKFGGGLRSKTFGMNWPVIQFMSVNICAALSDVSVAEWEQIPAGRSQKKNHVKGLGRRVEAVTAAA